MQINLKTLVRLFFLVLIFGLWLTGKITLWSIFLLTGLLATPFLGRIYCGWICPVFTSLDIFAPLLKKPLLKKYGNFLDNKVFKVLIFFLFILLFFLTRKLDFSVPFFIMLIPVGLLFTFLFGSARWHHICPFGTIFSLPARFAKYGYSFSNQGCSKCGLCIKNCENNCLHFDKNRNLYIEKKHCLVCGKCEAVCKQKNISFSKLNQSTKIITETEQGGTTL